MFLWALIPTSVKWIGLAVLIGLIGLGAWKWEHAGKLKAQAAKATAEQGLQIGYEGYVKLYQEREAIKARADQQRRKLNELRQKNDLDGLADTFNNPGGVRRPLSSNPKGGAKAPARYRAADGTPAEYQEAP
jgi:hypothetical protein